MTVTASRTYKPASFQDGIASFSPPFVVAVPSDILVIEGSAANHWVTLAINSQGVPVITCRYKGDAPSSSPSDRGMGGKYVFKTCDRGVAVGDVISATGVS